LPVKVAYDDLERDLVIYPTLFDDRLLLDFEQRCYPSASEIHVFRYRDQPAAYQISGRFDGIRPLIEQLGGPKLDNATYCVRWSSPAELFKPNALPAKRFQNYSVERFGLRIQPFPVGDSRSKLSGDIKDSKLFLSQPLYWFERSDYLVQVLRTRIFSIPVSAIRSTLSHPVSLLTMQMYIEERWHSRRGKARSLHWLEPRDRSKSEVDQFKRDAVRILDGVERIGRPPGTGKLQSRDKFTPAYREAYLRVEQRGEATHELVAHEMEISLSTFNRRLNKFDLTFPPDLA